MPRPGGLSEGGALTMSSRPPPDSGNDQEPFPAESFPASTGVNPATQRASATPAHGGLRSLPILSGSGMNPVLLSLGAALVLLLCICGGISLLVANNNSA